MAVDTANKRYSMMRLGQVVGLLPVPDGAIATADRAHFLGLYAGISLDVPITVAIAFVNMAISIEPAVRLSPISIEPAVRLTVAFNG